MVTLQKCDINPISQNKVNKIWPKSLDIQGVKSYADYVISSGWLHSQHRYEVCGMGKKIKAVCYCRVSTGSKEQANSFENQKEFFERYCSQTDDLELYRAPTNLNTGIYADRGISGTLLHREQFEKMLLDAGLDCGLYEYTPKIYKDVDDHQYSIKYKAYKIERTGKKPLFEEILVKNTSRFARNIQVAAILQELRNIGVYVTFLDIQKSTRNEADIPIIQFFQQFDEMFSRDLSRKLLSANQQSRQNQILRTNHDLYGFKYIPRKSRADNNRLVKIEQEAYVIQMIFRLYYGCFKAQEGNPISMPPCDFKCAVCPLKEQVTPNDGQGFRNILRLLNDTYGFRTRKGKPFAQSTIKHIFENEKVCGYLNNGKWNHGTVFNYFSSPKLREDYKDILQYRPDLIDPIISIELFDLCTSKRLEKAGDSTGVFRGVHTKYKGLIFCGKCGTVYTHNTASDKNRTGYYQCKTKRQKSNAYCGSCNVFDWQIDEKIKELCSGSIKDMIDIRNLEVLSTLYAQIKEHIAFIKRTRDETVIQELDGQIKTYSNGLKKLYTRMALETSDNDVLSASIQEMETQLADYRQQYEHLTKKPKTVLEDVQKLLYLCYDVIDSISKTKDTYTEDELLGSILEKLVIYGEPKRGSNGLWLTPEPSIVPVLKSEALLSSKLGIDADLTVESIVSTMGFEDFNFQDEIKTKMKALENEVNALKSLYL